MSAIHRQDWQEANTNSASIIKQAERADLLRFTTAGSVDDGKSTLIGRLLHDSKGIYEDQLSAVVEASKKSGQEGVDLALLTDGLKAEREQRITIDVAYRHFSTPRRRFIIADTPGHEQYTRNMATGASTADLAVILVDAQQGVVTQSKRHGFIASLLGIRHLLIAVNKMDLTDYSEERFREIVDEYTRFASGPQLHPASLEFIPVSALLGDNIVSSSPNTPWYNGPTLLEYLETVEIADEAIHRPARLAVQMVLRPNQDFRGYSGTISSGSIKLGDTFAAMSSGRKSEISRILTPQGETTQAGTGQAVTVCLTDDIDISRGDMLACPDEMPTQARELDAMLVWMDDQPLSVGSTLFIKHTTNMVRGKVTQVLHKVNPNTLEEHPTETLGLNDIGRIRLNLYRPIYCDNYAANRATGSFILIHPQTNATVAAGLVLESRGPANLTQQTGKVSSAERRLLLGQKPMTLWFSGLSASGKSTIAYALEARLISTGHACAVLDGDNIRGRLNRDLGFAPEDRSENIRRVAEVARLMNEAGLIVITSFISPYQSDRDMARELIGDGCFAEVFVDTPLEECEKRDPKGLYRRARKGELKEFTGISAPYEVPVAPELRLNTPGKSVDDLVDQCISYLKSKAFI